MNMFTYIHTYTPTHPHLHPHPHPHIQTYIHTYIHTYTHTHIHTCMHACVNCAKRKDTFAVCIDLARQPAHSRQRVPPTVVTGALTTDQLLGKRFHVPCSFHNFPPTYPIKFILPQYLVNSLEIVSHKFGLNRVEPEVTR